MTLESVLIKNGIQTRISGLYMNQIKVHFVGFVVTTGNLQHHFTLK